jgi:hypothetical protein
MRDTDDDRLLLPFQREATTKRGVEEEFKEEKE